MHHSKFCRFLLPPLSGFIKPCHFILALFLSLSCYAEVLITPTQLELFEGGDSASYQVVLTQSPSSGERVTVSPEPQDVSEANFSNPITFDESNFDVPQLITLTGLLGDGNDGDIFFTVDHQVSVNLPGGNYESSSADSIQVLVNNTEGVAVVTVQPSSDSKLFINEGSFQTITFGVGSTPPNASVTLELNSTHPQVVITPNQVTLNSTNNFIQTVELSVMNDGVIGGDTEFLAITSSAQSSDPFFSNISVVDITGRTIDSQKQAAVQIRPSSITTVEGGRNNFYQVSLLHPPLADETVTINPVSTDLTEGLVSPPIEFNVDNFRQPQLISVEPLTDSGNDGDVAFLVENQVSSSSPEGNYTALTTASVRVTNLNINDQSTIAIEPANGAELLLTEGNSQIISVSLPGIQATDAVDLAWQTSDQIVTNINTLSLNRENDFSAEFEITAINDGLIDGDIPFQVTFEPASSSDIGFGSQQPMTIDGIAMDNGNRAEIRVSPEVLETFENGESTSYQIWLEHPPAEGEVVTITTVSDDIGEVVANSEMEFSLSNFSTPQTVNVSPVIDDKSDSDKVVRIFNNTVSNQQNGVYHNFIAPDVTVTNRNIEGENIVTINPISGLGLHIEEGTSKSVNFAAPGNTPTDELIISLLALSNQIQFSPQVVTLNNSNGFSMDIEITSVLDFEEDGDQIATIETSAISSNDLAYNGITPADIRITAVDVDPIVPATIAFTTSAISVNESTSVVELEVERVGSLLGEITANLTFTNNETTDTDYVIRQTDITFAHTQSLTTVAIDLVDDSDVESTETFVVSLSNLTNATAGAIDSTVITIIDNDQSAPTPAPPPSEPQSSSGGGSNSLWVMLLVILLLIKRVQRHQLPRMSHTTP